MPWKDSLRRLWTGRQAASIATEVVRRCRPHINERIRPRAACMELAEARGYVRARSAAIVQDQTQYLLSKVSARKLRQSEIASAALESLVDLVIAELGATRQQKQLHRKAA